MSPAALRVFKRRAQTMHSFPGAPIDTPKTIPAPARGQSLHRDCAYFCAHHRTLLLLNKQRCSETIVRCGIQHAR